MKQGTCSQKDVRDYQTSVQFLLHDAHHHHYQQKQPPDVFYKKDVLKNFEKFTGKHLCQGLFFIEAAGVFL